MADQRKRTGLTREYEDWLLQQLARLSAKPSDQNVPRLSSPPLTKYADIEDPRAGRSRLGKPIGGFLDALVRPGRVEQMDADQRALRDRRMQYAEQRPAIQAQANALMTDNQLEELKLLALSGDPDASNLLGKYMQLLDPRSGGGVQPWGQIAAGLGPDGTKVVRKAGASGGDDPSTPSKNPYMNMSRAEAIDAYTEAINRLNKDDLEAQAITEKSGEGLSRGGWKASDLYEAGIPMENLGITPGMKQKAEQRLERNKQVKDALTKQISAAHDWSPTNAGGPPLTSPPAAGPTEYIPNR